MNNTSDLRHPNIVNVYGIVFQPDKPLCLIIEFAAKGDLHNRLHNEPPQSQSLSQSFSQTFSPVLPPLTPEERLKIAQDVAKGMLFLHSKNPKIVHRDLKSSNILVSSNLCMMYSLSSLMMIVLILFALAFAQLDEHLNAKIADFGVAKIVHTCLLTTVGTASYSAPEVLDTESYNEKADIYSFGIVL